jgi:hypothetical protein
MLVVTFVRTPNLTRSALCPGVCLRCSGSLITAWGHGEPAVSDYDVRNCTHVAATSLHGPRPHVGPDISILRRRIAKAREMLCSIISKRQRNAPLSSKYSVFTLALCYPAYQMVQCYHFAWSSVNVKHVAWRSRVDTGRLCLRIWHWGE